MMINLKQTNLFLLTVFCLTLLGCAAQPTPAPLSMVTLGDWFVNSVTGLHLADVFVRQSMGQPTAIQIDLFLYHNHDVVDLSLALPPCYQPQHRTVNQWANPKAGPLSWTTRWFNAGGCAGAEATLLYQFSTATDGVKGHFAFSIQEL